MYRLKKNRPAIQIVDGPDDGRKFEHNREYDQVPVLYKDWFELVPQQTAPVQAAPEPADPEPAKPKTRKGGDA